MRLCLGALLAISAFVALMLFSFHLLGTTQHARFYACENASFLIRIKPDQSFDRSTACLVRP